MTPSQAIDLIQSGGVVACLAIALWAFVTRRIVSRGEFDRLDDRCKGLETKIEQANTELLKQSTTNARLVEMTMLQRQEAETVRRGARSHQEAQDERPE
jgi:hypothetical protein